MIYINDPVHENGSAGLLAESFWLPDAEACQGATAYDPPD